MNMSGWNIAHIILTILGLFQINGAQNTTISSILSELNIISPSCIARPYTCPHPKIKFYLYTRNTPLKGELLNLMDPESLYRTNWNPKHRVKLIVHGFNSGTNHHPIPDIRKAYFSVGEYNIITVDFGETVRKPCLSQLHWAPSFLGMCIAHFVKFLNKHQFGVRPEMVHIIGYSMGTHVAGLVANSLTKADGKIGRITGLDPSILFSTGSKNMTLDLDKSDAHFVDIIHTSAGVVGQWYPSGHADFYVNGGTRQNSCSNSSLVANLACDHNIVPKYFIESITSKVGFWGIRCSGLVSYLVGWCQSNEYALMGEYANHRTRGIYYVNTNTEPPYARGLPSRRKRFSIRS